mgnify:CR=1 FL=1
MGPSKTSLLLALRRVLAALVEFPKLGVGVAVLLTLIVLAGLASVLVPYDPTSMMRVPPDLPPSSQHLLGTDTLGRDVAAQLIHSIRQSLMIGAMAGSIGTLIGIVVGFMAGYKGGLVDSGLRTLIDVFLVIPMWPLMVVIASYVQFLTVPVMAGLLAAFSWPWPARAMRAQVMSLGQREFVNLAKLTNLNSFEIAFQEIMPNMLSYIGANFANAVAGAMMAEVGLEIIGLGPQNTTTLGLMLYWAMWRGALVRGITWWVFPPIVVLISVFISLHLINMGLDEVYNPRLRR